MAAPTSPEFTAAFPDGMDDSTPVVVVLGWYGAQDRHLSKYSALLNREGFPTVRGIMPPAAVFSPFERPRRRYASRLLDFVAALEPWRQPQVAPRPIVFYVFSNGGAFVLEQLEQLVHGEGPQYQQYRDRVAGIVFDSAPCYMHLLTGATAIGAGLAAPLRLLAAAIFLLSVLVLMFVAPRRPQQYWQRMRDLRLGRRSLFLYSADDPLCDADKVDELVAHRRQRGGSADVAQAVRWQRSQHVGHLLKHPKEYKAALLGFLRSCG